MNPWEESWDTRSVKLSFDDALKAEGVTGKAADIARSIYQQESGSGRNTKTSNAGAVGGMQIIPATFKSVAEKDWDINDPFYNSRAGIRYIKQLFEKADGDPALTAAGYYGGPGGLEKARRGVAVSDPRNPNAPTTLEYGQQVAARLPKEPEAKMPWEEQWDVPAAPKSGGATGSWEEKEKPGMVASLGAGLGKGTGAVALGAQDLVGRGINAVSSEGTPGAKLGQWLRSDAQAGREKLAAENAPYKAANPITNATGEIGGNVLATLPVGAGLGTLATKAGAPALGAAIASGGMRTGVEAAPGALGAIANMGTRMAGGAIAGGASAGLVDADSATTGAAIGAALPPVVKGLGAAGSALARTIRGPAAPESVRVAAEAARQAGYVIPPTQVKPSLGNRLLEGMSGKITTAQNASARNQEVTNKLAQRAIGAAELSPEGLQAVRNQANGAYSALGKAGEFSADDAFRQALQKVGAPSSKLKQDFPALANKELEGIVDSFSSTKNFDAQSAIEAIKELRAAQRAGIKSMDPATVAMARAKGKISDALEDLVERNLTAKGDEGLLTAYREARQTLAKVYDVEKALNPATGNVDAKKLGNLLKKGRLTGDLKTAGEFAASFPKAAQTMENMGSLPQTSPLDWSAGLMASAASGSPLGMVGVAARPAARAMTLSPFVQNRLAQTQALPMLTQNAQRNLLQPLYRAGPVLSSDR
jgi:hypothetical protein